MANQKRIQFIKCVGVGRDGCILSNERNHRLNLSILPIPVAFALFAYMLICHASVCMCQRMYKTYKKKRFPHPNPHPRLLPPPGSTAARTRTCGKR